MTYNEWRDELKNNLLCVSESERQRVLDYYAEAYADRREAGFSEREIIADFGAPYDAAQRILNDEYEECSTQTAQPRHQALPQRERRAERSSWSADGEQSGQSTAAQDAANKKSDYTWVFVLLCIIFAFPLFGLIMGMVGITIGLCVAPFAMLMQGMGNAVVGIIDLFSNVGGGLINIGFGIAEIGLAIILIPLCIKLVKLMWQLFKKLFSWIKAQFSGKERAQ